MGRGNRGRGRGEHPEEEEDLYEEDLDVSSAAGLPAGLGGRLLSSVLPFAVLRPRGAHGR